MGADGMEQSLFYGQLKFDLMSLEDATIACSKVVVVASSHRRNPGSIPRGSQILAVKQTPIPAICDRFPGGETYQFRYCEPFVKKQWGQR